MERSGVEHRRPARTSLAGRGEAWISAGRRSVWSRAPKSKSSSATAWPPAAELVVAVVVAGHRVGRGARLLGRLDPHVAVPLEAGAGRDELADDHVLLQAAQ